ncbi:MAG: protein kinase [Myxococcales bacterium]|nr:protein kinase [Myxococcales bacterium]
MQSAPAPHELIGKRIGGKYEVRSLLAEGGMGVVYEAMHVDINRKVALKMLHPDVLDTEGSQRFLNEARAVNEARHRNIVEVSDYGIDHERTFLVMEYLEGATLREWREALPDAPAPVVLRTLLPIGRALSFAHQRGFVHRDVKPENILVAREEGNVEPTPKLLDFGVAKIRNNRERLTRTGATLGTPLYMAPEQIGASRDVGPEADQYAFACVLWECIARTSPFAAKNLATLAMAKATTDPPHLAIALPELPVALGDIVARALARDPEARWPSMDALCDALEPFADGGPIPWVPSPDRRRVPTTIEPTIDGPAPAGIAPSPVSSNAPIAFAPTDLPPPSTPDPDDSARVAQLELPSSRPPQPSTKSKQDDETKKVPVARAAPSAIESTAQREVVQPVVATDSRPRSALIVGGVAITVVIVLTTIAWLLR